MKRRKATEIRLSDAVIARARDLERQFVPWAQIAKELKVPVRTIGFLFSAKKYKRKAQ